jgi:hypothetical protein
VYCPKCATQNADDARFCRACGLAVDVVALALDGKLVPKDSLLGVSKRRTARETAELKRSKGIRDLITGSTMLIVSLLILMGPMPFIRQTFGWLVIWSCIFGWMTVWGSIALANGIGRVIHSSALRQDQESELGVLAGHTTSNLLGDLEEKSSDAVQASGYDMSASTSVTETTTRHLDSHTE